MKNIYHVWKDKNELKSKLDLIKKLSSTGANEDMIAIALGISKRTFQSLKNKHSDMKDAYEEGKERFKGMLMDAIIKRAVGFKSTDEDQYIEETARGTKKRIIKHIKDVPPDIGAAKYLLTIHFGREYSDKKLELELAEKKMEKLSEEWINGDHLQEIK